MKQAGNWTLAAVTMGLLLAGCESAPPPVPPPPPPAPGFSVPQSRALDASLLANHTQQLDSEVAQLPGSSAEQHRVILLSLLEELPRVLKLANGPVESPEFQNQLSVIESAAATIRGSDVDRRRMEAVENQALQAATPALADITARIFYDDDQLPPLLQTLGAKVDVAAGSMGPIHDIDATNAFSALEAVVDRISQTLSQRVPPGV